MRFLSITFFILVVFGYSNISSAELLISEEVHNNEKLELLHHSGPGKFDNYLVQNLQFSPVRELYKSLEEKLETPLINRGEAHITVITPIEFNKILKKYITMDDIDEIANEMSIQESGFSIVCLGRGQTEIAENLEQAYYIVVESEDLIAIRWAIFDRYVENGGEPSKFDPEGYYPHITVGFAVRDLHESDGIKKGKNSCFSDIVEAE